MAHLASRRHNAVPEGFEHGTRLLGEVEWVLTGTADELDAAAQSLGGIYRPVVDGVALLNFGNAVGFFTIPGVGLVEVVSGKWDSADFERMLAEITNTAAGLPFAADVAASLPYDRSIVARQDVLYHLFVYLRSILSEYAPQAQQLLPALRLIVQTPHQRFARTRWTVPLDRVQRIDSIGITQLVLGRHGLALASAAQQARLPLAGALRGHLPERMTEAHIEISHDTAENRFIKAFLGNMEAIIAAMADCVRKQDRQDAFCVRLLGDCASMSRALRPLLQHPLWREVGPMVQLPLSSAVLQGRRGYREVYEHFVRLRLAAQIPLSEELIRDLLEAKDVAQLYEVWCFFALVREITRLRGVPARADGPQADEWGLSMRWDMEVAWADGTRMLYNPRFSRSRPSDRRSYSVPLRPDIALHMPAGPNAGLHLFDAKFKLDKIGDLMPAGPVDDEERDVRVEERRGTFKRGDLYKMHAYRDAIACARSVWILYPGSEFRHYAPDGRLATSHAGGDLRPVEGVGAIPLTPADTEHELMGSVVAHLIA